MAKDYVCGMEVNEESPSAVSMYQGKKYYFCSRDCKEKFDKIPEFYLNPLFKAKKSRESQ